jgi:membrane-bound lytic murein transglycosylase D
MRYLLRLALPVMSLMLAACASTPLPPATPAAAPAPLPVLAVPPLLEPVAEVASASLPPGPRPPRARLDPKDDAAQADLWQRMRDGFAMPDLEAEPWRVQVQKWEQYYATRADYLKRMTDRGARYLFHIVEELQLREMPMELALLPFIESAFDPEAMSRARASGMWQFMPATGKDFELRQNVFRDDRRDVLASTRAALDYLQRLHKRFGDWHLALAAYNWGQGNVQRALDANSRSGRASDYASLKMPDETRNYVPKLQAMKNIIANPANFGLALTPLANHPYFVSVAIEHDIDVSLVARLAGLGLDAFRQLNPQLNKPVILAAGTPRVLLPYDNANQFVQGLPEHQGSRASWTAWVAPRTLKPAEAAKLVGMPEVQLREVNQIPERMLVTVGSTLLVPRAATAARTVKWRGQTG